MDPATIAIQIEPSNVRLFWLMAFNNKLTELTGYAESLRYWEERSVGKGVNRGDRAHARQRVLEVRRQLYDKREEFTQWVIDHPAPPLVAEDKPDVSLPA